MELEPSPKKSRKICISIPVFSEENPPDMETQNYIKKICREIEKEINDEMDT